MQSTIAQAATAAPTTAKGGIFDPAGGRPVNTVRPKEPDRSSLTLITLQIRSKNGFFNDWGKNLAFDAGFDLVGSGAGEVGLLSRDTRKPIALLKVDGFDAAVGELRVAEVQIDTATCPTESEGGTRLRLCVAKLAHLVDGTVCDGTGREMSDVELEALGDHIDDVLARRADNECLARRIVLPNGDIRYPGGLSFQHFTHHEVEGGRRREVRPEFFDAQPMPLHGGRARGEQMALELVKFFKEHQEAPARLTATIADALGAALPRGSLKEPSRENVAIGFLDAIEALVRFASKQCGTQWLENRIARNTELQRALDAEAQEQKAEFVQRMRAARAAKKAGQRAGAA